MQLIINLSVGSIFLSISFTDGDVSFSEDSLLVAATPVSYPSSNAYFVLCEDQLLSIIFISVNQFVF